MKIIATFTEPLLENVSSFGDRIFVSREKSAVRRVANNEELYAQLQQRGFKKVILEELTWKEQINAFRNAKVIVAPHGAGLANLVFCCPGTKVVEFFNRAYAHWCFWQLAAIKGLDYRPVVPITGGPLSHSMSKCIEDLEADVRQILTTLSE